MVSHPGSAGRVELLGWQENPSLSDGGRVLFGRQPDPHPEVLAVRFLDVTIIGPLMVLGALKAESMHKAARLALGFFGVTTIIFNGVNLVRGLSQPQSSLHDLGSR